MICRCENARLISYRSSFFASAEKTTSRSTPRNVRSPRTMLAITNGSMNSSAASP